MIKLVDSKAETEKATELTNQHSLKYGSINPIGQT